MKWITIASGCVVDLSLLMRRWTANEAAGQPLRSGELPATVLALGGQVQDRARREGVAVLFQAHVFYTDPILTVTVGGATAALAIWDYDEKRRPKLKIHNIAKLT